MTTRTLPRHVRTLSPCNGAAWRAWSAAGTPLTANWCRLDLAPYPVVSRAPSAASGRGPGPG